MSETIYYQRNREVILNRAKDHENNKKLVKTNKREREQKINTENYGEKKDIIKCLKKIRKN